ncbi:hypothetical protein KSB_47680 [Ktedonobacter robiniae]|uniref:Uncharacterized protein n=1 Tax=Ktedonobacter robiniae TaxID=2778365 RepID=A0ABQ3UU53_9CHLR|nr:hypothetical protein KSB_47680 [Ktedonobacter robiniae]
MGWMIADAKLLLDQHCHPSCGPDLAAKSIVFGSFGQQVRQLDALFLASVWVGDLEAVGGAAHQDHLSSLDASIDSPRLQ